MGGSAGDAFNQGMQQLGNNFDAGKANFSSNLGNIWGGLSNKDNYDPSKGTLGQVGAAFGNGDWGKVQDQITGGYNDQVAPVLNNVNDKLKSNLQGQTTAQLGTEGVTGLMGLPFGTGITLGGAGQAIGASGNLVPGAVNDVEKKQNDEAAGRQSGDQAVIQGQQAQQRKQQQQQDQNQQQQQNKAGFDQQNSLEDALRAAALKKQGSNANANFY